MLRRSLTVVLTLFLLGTASVDAQGDKKPEPVKPIPPPGDDVPGLVRSALKKKLGELNQKLAGLRRSKDAAVQEHIPDVEIFARAIEMAGELNTFYKGDDQVADKLLDAGLARAAELSKGEHSWTQQTGLAVRGYRSKLDGTVQPYGLVIGEEYAPQGDATVRCDIWFHGRGEKLSELQFLNEHMNRAGEYQLAKGIVLHPYGRYCNAFRFAGEVDTLEALEHVQQHYRINPDLISVRGFSMGGAACWDFTVHYPDRWFAANPGAGFSETMQFLRMDKDPSLLPPEYQQKLWNLYDAHVLAENLFDVPTIAYSGEIDGQKQAADVMVAAAAKYGLEFPHIIGPMTPHKIHADSKVEIAAKMDQLAEEGRTHAPAKIRFTTYTLKYHKCFWITLNGLEEHWREAHVQAEMAQQEGQPTQLVVTTRNITDFTVDFPAADSPFGSQSAVVVNIDGAAITGLTSAADRAFHQRFQKKSGGWQKVADDAHDGLAKRHNLQGPVDDALMDSFIFVKPTGKPLNPAAQKWAMSEYERAVREWKRQMRGEAPVKSDAGLTPEEIRNNNLILWGDPGSNAILKKISAQLPIKWTQQELAIGDQKFDPAQHAAIFIYPNPLNPERYIVVNSGLTYREFDYLNNARQTPKLPDWAIVDFSQPPDEKTPGKILAADFFDEHWQPKPPAK